MGMAVACPMPFSPAGKQALEGLTSLPCAAWVPVFDMHWAAPIDVALTCACLAVIHLSEVYDTASSRTTETELCIRPLVSEVINSCLCSQLPCHKYSTL